MEQFPNATIIKKANSYFGGLVTSRTVILDGGEKKTLGIMMPGRYEFGTELREVMEILDGILDVKLPDQDRFITKIGGETFEVPANSKFEVVVKQVTDYCCSYLPE